MATEYPAGYSAPSGGGLVTAVGAIRKDDAGTLAADDGDYAPLQVDAAGNLRVTAGESAAAADDGVQMAILLQLIAMNEKLDLILNLATD